MLQATLRRSVWLAGGLLLSAMVSADVENRSAADEALNLLDHHPGIGAIFTDVVMPGSMDGATLAERVRETHPHVPVIVTSGQQGYDPAELPVGVRFVPKPYTGHEIIRLIKDISAAPGHDQAAFAW